MFSEDFSGCGTAKLNLLSKPHINPTTKIIKNVVLENLGYMLFLTFFIAIVKAKYQGPSTKLAEEIEFAFFVIELLLKTSRNILYKYNANSTLQLECIQANTYLLRR